MNKCVFYVLLLALLPGCGPSPEVLKKQEEKLKADLKAELIDPPGMSASDRAARRRRIELQYGPEAAEQYDEMNREKSAAQAR